MTDPGNDWRHALRERDAPGPHRTTRREWFLYWSAAVIGAVIVMNVLQRLGLWS